ncbi:PIN domain-containing protein [Kineococcus sp. SYSU DK005]|uniref:hypothetical protein n=1 Tax=Kineococcus sp. SYSU DK005 TaxID=3383126 RepID=UPI003D7E0DC4
MSFLLDESAHDRRHQPVVTARWNKLLRADLLAIARPNVPEIGFSAAPRRTTATSSPTSPKR